MTVIVAMVIDYHAAGTLTVTNDETGTPERGNFDCVLYDPVSGVPAHKAHIHGFDRSLGPWKLAEQAIGACLYVDPPESAKDPLEGTLGLGDAISRGNCIKAAFRLREFSRKWRARGDNARVGFDELADIYELANICELVDPSPAEPG